MNETQNISIKRNSVKYRSNSSFTSVKGTERA